MLEDYFTQISLSQEYSPTQIGHAINIFQDAFPNLENSDIALFRVVPSQDEDNSTDKVREAFYQLMSHTSDIQVADLGNIIEGKTPKDTTSVMSYISEELLKMDVIPICLGSHLDQSEAIYHAFQKLEKPTEITLVSHCIPILEYELLHRICTSEPNYLLNMNSLAFQAQYIPKTALDTLENLNFGHLRLGSLKQNLELAEVYLRNAGLAIFDINAVQHADAPGKPTIQPSGLTSEEACQLAKYAGISDSNQAFFLSGYAKEKDKDGLTATLCAHILWYFVDGVTNRSDDLPETHQEFVKYRCDLDKDAEPILFLKSKKTQRWWMQIEHPSEPENKSNTLTFPCSYRDYQEAASGETPQRYLDALRKLA